MSAFPRGERHLPSRPDERTPPLPDV